MKPTWRPPERLTGFELGIFMLGSLLSTYSRWRHHPKRWDVSFISAAMSRRYRARRQWPVNTTNVSILSDQQFRKSVAQVEAYTMLDVARLANLWSLANLAGPGIFLEVGSYKG